jgi:hypothetical protein
MTCFSAAAVASCKAASNSVRVSSGYLSATWVTIRGAVTPMRIRVEMLADRSLAY